MLEMGEGTEGVGKVQLFEGGVVFDKELTKLVKELGIIVIQSIEIP